MQFPNNQLDDSGFLNSSRPGITMIERQRNQAVYAQGDAANAVFYLQNGHVKLTALSEQGKEAAIAILANGDFFGEACLAGYNFRHETATALTSCLIKKIAKNEMMRTLREHRELAEFFLSYVLSRNVHLQADLVDQLCNSCEKRLARVLLLLASAGQGAGSATIVPKVNQVTLAAMVGTTQPRISFLLNKFREKGFIEYGEELRVNRSLMEIVLHNAACFETRA